MIQHTSSGVSGASGLKEGLDLSRSAMPLSKRGSPILRYHQQKFWLGQQRKYTSNDAIASCSENPSASKRPPGCMSWRMSRDAG